MDNVIINLVVIIILLTINGFFVAAEFALVKARGFRIETMANGGNLTAKLTLRIQKNLEAYLAACQLGITMASLGLGWVAEPAVAAVLEPLFFRLGVPETILHTVAFVVGFLIFSSLHIIVGVQIPKTLAIRKAEPVALWVAYPLHVAYLLAFPLNWLLNASTRAILSLFNVAEATHADVYSGDELKGLVSTSGEHGEIHADNAEVLRNMFEFDQRYVGRVMLPRSSLKLLDINHDTEHNLIIIRDSGHSRFPLIDSVNDNAILGIILAKDLYAAMLRDDKAPGSNLRRYCREPLIVPESQKVARLFSDMHATRAHMALVIDEYGKLIGLVTLEDLLEEIVGDIEDENDFSASAYIITPMGEDRWEADGLVSLSDAERSIGLVVPDQLDANTLSGLCVATLGELPMVDDEIIEYGYRFTILSVENHRVGKLLIEKMATTPTSDKLTVLSSTE